jgi:hypothetical protein
VEEFSQLVSDVIEAIRNFILDFRLKNPAKNCENHKAHKQKVRFLFLGPSKKIVTQLSL